mgnify:CR=1 FL=1
MKPIKSIINSLIYYYLILENKFMGCKSTISRQFNEQIVDLALKSAVKSNKMYIIVRII